MTRKLWLLVLVGTETAVPRDISFAVEVQPHPHWMSLLLRLYTGCTFTSFNLNLVLWPLPFFQYEERFCAYNIEKVRVAREQGYFTLAFLNSILACSLSILHVRARTSYLGCRGHGSELRSYYYLSISSSVH